MSKSIDQKYDHQGVASSTSSGMFRSFLNNVGTVVGTSNTVGLSLDHRVRALTEEVGVLQEELESKILENERLVMGSSEIRRALQISEDKCQSMEIEVSGYADRFSNLSSELELALRSTNQLCVEKEKSDILLDGYKRELELNAERIHLLVESNKDLKNKDNELKASLTQISEISSKLSLAESRCEQFYSKLKIEQSQMNLIQTQLTNEQALTKSLNVRIEQLEEQLAIVAVSESFEEVIPCNNDPCCYKSEYYQGRCKNLEAALLHTN